MSVTVSGKVIEPRDVLTVTASPSAAPISVAVSADSRTTDCVRGPGQIRLAVLQAAVVEQHPPAGQYRFAGPGWAGSLAATVGTGAYSPSQIPSADISSRAGWTLPIPR